MQCLARKLPILFALWLASCAPVVAVQAPTSAPVIAQPSSAPVAFDAEEIPPGVCAPPFHDGLFLSWDSARALVLAARKREHEHALARLSTEEQAALAESRARVAEEKAAAHDSWWERYKFWIGLGAGAVLTGSAFVGGAMIVKR